MQNKESSIVVPNTAHVLLHLATAGDLIGPNAQTSPTQSNQTNEANDPRPNDLGSICHSTLPWLISSSLVDSSGGTAMLRAMALHDRAT